MEEKIQLEPNEIYVRIQYLKDRKIIDIIRYKKEEHVHEHKEEPIEGKSISSKIVQNKNEIIFNP